MKEDFAACRDFFDGKAAQWDAFSEHDAAIIEAILTVGGDWQGQRVLDLACGTGVLFPFLRARQPAYLRAIDLSPAMIAQAKRKYAPSPDFRIDAMNFYDLEEGGFDRIVVYNAYPHFLNKAAFAGQVQRCLRPGGRLLIAHGAGRNQINGCHADGKTSVISAGLQGCAQEQQRLGQGFCWDTAVDNPYLYILSGTYTP